MPKLVQQRYNVPLLNQGQPNVATELANLKTRDNSKIMAEIMANSHPVIKPERDLGAGYITDSVARDLNVNLCDFCWRKYERWWATCDYRPDWDTRWRTDCMGCSARMVPCVSFYREDKFYQVLTESYGRMPEPNRKLYFDT
jgi:hypothetical protein